MKFDLYNWQEVNNNVKTEAAKGRLRVQCSAPAPLYVEAFGVETLAGYGTSFDLDFAEAVIWRVEGPKATRVFVWTAERTSAVCEGEVYTNIDRMPGESGTVLEVTKALRNLELQRRQILGDIRREAALARAAAQLAPQSQPALQGDPAPVADPAPDAELKADA